MNTIFVSTVELPLGFLPLDPCDLQLNCGGRLPYGGIATEGGKVFRFTVHHSDEITFIPPLPPDMGRWDVEFIEGAIHATLEGKRARRVAYLAELDASERRRLRARSLTAGKVGAGR